MSIPTVGYEVAPPRIIGVSDLEGALRVFYSRIEELKKVVDRVLVTSAVMGRPRLPSIYTASMLKRVALDLTVDCSLRTSDYTLREAFRRLSEAAALRVDGVLLVYGDKPQYGYSHRTFPSTLLKVVRSLLPRAHVPRVYLSAPVRENRASIEGKLKARPDGFITEVITSAEQITWLRDICKANSIELIATILVPSLKNLPSANMMGLEWKPDVEAMIEEARSLLRQGISISLTSPWSFSDGVSFAKRLREQG